MKTTFTAIALIVSTFAFSQKINLSKNEAYQRFKNSNIRKELQIPLKSFNYDTLKFKARLYKVNLSNMVVLNSTNDKKFLLQTANEYNRGKPNQKGEMFCSFCTDIPYYDIHVKNFGENYENGVPK